MSDNQDKTTYSASALFEKIRNESEVVKVDHMSKQIVVKFHKPTDDFYECIEKFGYMLMEALNFNLKMRAYETEVLKNPRDYVKEDRSTKVTN